MKMRTVTRQNGHENEREMHFGIDVIGTVGAIIGAGFAAWLSLRLDVKAIQTQQMDDTLHLPVVIRDTAVDAVPLLGGKPVWRYDASDGLWAVAVAEGDMAGLEWAGRWRSFREYVHWQDTGGTTLTAAYNELHPTAEVA